MRLSTGRNLHVFAPCNERHERIEKSGTWNSGKASSTSLVWLSLAYAEAAKVLCNALVAEDYSRQFTSTRVILHLCRHAAELFLKGAIESKTGKRAPATHRLDRLFEMYDSISMALSSNSRCLFRKRSFDRAATIFSHRHWRNIRERMISDSDTRQTMTVCLSSRLNR